MKNKFIALLTLMSALLVQGSARGQLFEDGETVCFLGDSITHVGTYHSMVCAYYLTRFPDRTIRFVNAGVAGDTAGGALGRLKEDVISRKPTSVAVMFGMNDVGRGNYVISPNEKRLAARERSLTRYRGNNSL